MNASKPDKEMEQFQADLLQGVREMNAGIAGRVTRVALTPHTARHIALGQLKAKRGEED
ncbi:hypothetical protein [Burkholderia ubonensis]|uniref:hypothetical protein n=1 Tax=Burkholderia ubonensis TaxID=101571 RepID=UPI0015C6F72B|nr:hypothetical protein [Burkholderia ubonensis]